MTENGKKPTWKIVQDSQKKAGLTAKSFKLPRVDVDAYVAACDKIGQGQAAVMRAFMQAFARDPEGCYESLSGGKSS